MQDLDERMPILVGCGDITDLDTPVSQGRSPYDLIAQASRLALDDTGASGIDKAIDTVAMIRSFADTSHRFATRLGTSTNPPRSVANRLGLQPGRHIYSYSGGNMPQYLVNKFAEAISRGEMRGALLCGGEALRTQYGVERANLPVTWAENPGGEPELIGDPRRGWNDHEDKHNMRAAIAMYPLFENAIRGARGRTIEQHMPIIGELMAGFARVAAANPLATRREGRTAQQLVTVDDENRWIGFPYPRFLNSNAFIDQAAAVVMTSVKTARELGIPESKWVFLHGCADGHDHWYVSDRINLHSSPAIRAASRLALSMAGRSIADFTFLDLYSCFSSAVEIGCQELGIAENDPRGLTVTGGLPFFGGPGNNYVTHSISEMVRRVRSRPGSFGLVTANGNYVTKHSFGVYSTTPVKGSWARESPSVLQAQLDALPKAPFTETPQGSARIETYTVMHGRHGPEYALIYGRLDSTGERFLANSLPDAAVMWDLQNREGLGRAGTVSQVEGRNVFVAAD
ncbi:MAG TPA: acetyl-CoA acetyltransferase [Burkholderiaceae bacterium]|jgi:acetyl-CoA C-acetyltransferase|nr:acetyl-CoA acetyltransferase [Burkholderiaceae bacterium]